MAFLEIDNIFAGYGRGPDILRGLSVAIEQGQVVCVIGPNGAGKSTLLKVISGLLHPREGEVRLRGEPISSLRPDQVLQNGICFVPQERSLFPDMTVRENIRMGGYVIKDRKELERRIDEVFEAFPRLRERSGQRARTLSGGEQQMLAMGRTLVLQPEIVMLDEPSLGLAPRIVEQVFDIISLFTSKGMTVLLVEQNAQKGLEYSDWCCVLDLGTMLFEGSAASVLDDPRIQELYLGKRGHAQSDSLAEAGIP